MGIYVEILIASDMREVWRHSQEPDLHEQWDLRFSRIQYLPRSSPDAPQHFLYATRIGGGFEISGEGESTTRADADSGARTSSLQFWSNAPYSLIRRGSGYWRYIPDEGGVKFLTWYDYDTRFGVVGRVVDRVAFRPLLGWATAWSFDRLRLWLEAGTRPAAAFRQAMTHGISRLVLAAVFFYHGLVPKLLFHDAAELAMFGDAGVPDAAVRGAANVSGVAELAFAAFLLLWWRARWPSAVAAALMTAATAGVAIMSPRYLTAAFNPVTLNLSVAALALVDLLNVKDLPTASRCRRSPEEPT